MTTQTFAGAQARLREFAADRNWFEFHSPRNLMLALVGEIGELAEIMQWAHDIDLMPGARNPATTRRLSEEVADVAIYLLRLADVLGLDLPEIIAEKIDRNAEKYPAAAP